MCVARQVKDPRKEIIEPSIIGVRNMLDSLSRAPKVRRLVHTSSVIAVSQYVFFSLLLSRRARVCAPARSLFSLALALARRPDHTVGWPCHPHWPTTTNK